MLTLLYLTNLGQLRLRGDALNAKLFAVAGILRFPATIGIDQFPDVADLFGCAVAHP
jgi:hypothetical protein